MPQILHCGHVRRTKAYWLYSDDPAYKYQILLTSTCPKCGRLILEWQGAFQDGRRGPQRRIAWRDHERWLSRTSLATGDIAQGVDASQWETQKSAIHLVHSSLRQHPYTQIMARVE